MQSGKRLLVCQLPQPNAINKTRNGRRRRKWHNCVVYGGAAQYAANPKGTHVLIEGELTCRAYSRTIEAESGPVKAQWPVAEIVVESIKVLDRERKETNEMEGAA